MGKRLVQKQIRLSQLIQVIGGSAVGLLLLVICGSTFYGYMRTDAQVRGVHTDSIATLETLKPLEQPSDSLFVAPDAPAGLDYRAVAQNAMPEAYAALPTDEDGWEKNYSNPCFAATDTSGKVSSGIRCVPFFYVLGSFHSGAKDLFDRISAHPDVFRPPRQNPYFFSEVHMWDRVLWRGCDFGGCPSSRGMGAIPLPLPSELEAAPQRVMGEAAGGVFTFTWSLTHSLLHHAWDQNMTDCWKAGFQGPTNYKCFPGGRAAQDAWEASVGGGTEGALTVPWLMRGIHGAGRVRFLAVLRNPVERVHSAFWYWPQYRRKTGACPPLRLFSRLYPCLPRSVCTPGCSLPSAPACLTALPLSSK
ncbi:hypothetical protein CYMTET_32131, partial [Cymbomonas tetramitiformis]